MEGIKEIKYATYYFPNYHIDAHNESVHGKGWTEWELVKNAKPRFKGHYQPKIPLWGFEDESDPKVMAKKIKTAKEYGIDCFIFDSYFYENENFLNGCLDNGFLKAENTNDMGFALMWANHCWSNIHPATLDVVSEMEFDGIVSPKAFKRITNEIINEYFTKPNYYRVDGKPYFSIYEIKMLERSLGGADGLKKALLEFREDARKVVGEIHINALIGEISLLPNEKMDCGFNFLNQFDFDSYTSYCWLHHYEMPDFPVSSYNKCAKSYIKGLNYISCSTDKPYFPNITMGWDASPRTNQNGEFKKSDYPYSPVLKGNTPERFGKYLKKITKWAAANTNNPMVIINAWNEWTEGTYLEPDKKNGYEYLRQIRKVKNISDNNI